MCDWFGLWDWRSPCNSWTNRLPFNLLNITENVSSIGPRSELRGDFLAETSQDEENIFKAIDPSWTGASMTYAHILRDSDDCMLGCNCNNHGDRIQDLRGDIQWNSRNSWRIWGFPQTSIDSTSRRGQATMIEDDDEEATLEPGEAEETLAYQYQRQRRGRASRYMTMTSLPVCDKQY